MCLYFLVKETVPKDLLGRFCSKAIRNIVVRAQVVPSTDDGQMPDRVAVLWRGNDAQDQITDMVRDDSGGWGGYKAELPPSDEATSTRWWCATAARRSAASTPAASTSGMRRRSRARRRRDACRSTPSLPRPRQPCPNKSISPLRSFLLAVVMSPVLIAVVVLVVAALIVALLSRALVSRKAPPAAPPPSAELPQGAPAIKIEIGEVAAPGRAPRPRGESARRALRGGGFAAVGARGAGTGARLRGSEGRSRPLRKSRRRRAAQARLRIAQGRQPRKSAQARRGRRARGSRGARPRRGESAGRGGAPR